MTHGARSPAACALVTRDYVAYARVLAESYHAHHGDGRFYLLVLDGLPQGVAAGPDIEAIQLEDLGCPFIWEMAVRYSALELSCALKPWLVSHVLEQRGEESAYYFDSDILIFRRLHESESMLAEGAGMVLTPHILRPIEPDGFQPDELYILRAGVCNMGFFGVSRTQETLALLQWWSSRLRNECMVDLARGVFLDQRWADMIPSFLSSTVLLRNDAYNVAYWNIDSRRLDERDGSLLVNGQPAAFVHFSGIEPETRAIRRSYRSRPSDSDEVLAGLIAAYVARLESQGLEECRTWRYAFGSFDNGVPIHPLFRHLYLNSSASKRQAFGNPFHSASSTSFFEWSVSSDPDLAHLSPLLIALFETDTDAQMRFPDVGGAHRAAFIRWAGEEGARRHGFDPGLIRADPLLQLHPQRPSVEVPHGNLESQMEALRWRLEEKEEELRRIRGSRLWRLGGLYWNTRELLLRISGKVTTKEE